MTSLYRCPWKYLDNRHGSGFPNRLYSQSMSWCYEKAANNIDAGSESTLPTFQ